ncbi:MAG TPA: hypothetical protein VD993_05510 [Chitinophagaceae bacterium]|nr:hypothetical protein [Chitinophagaceae bacterium]
MAIMSVLITFTAGAVLSLCLAAWVKGSAGERWNKVAPWAFSLAALGFLSGYAYEIISTYIKYQ